MTWKRYCKSDNSHYYYIFRKDEVELKKKKKNIKFKIKELLSSKMTDSVSSIHTEKDAGINNLITSSVLLCKSSSRSRLHEILNKSLLKIQAHSLDIDISRVTDDTIKELLETGTIKLKTNRVEKKFVKPNISVCIPSQFIQNSLITETETQKAKIKIDLKNDTELELSPLGKAALKGIWKVPLCFI